MKPLLKSVAWIAVEVSVIVPLHNYFAVTAARTLASGCNVYRERWLLHPNGPLCSSGFRAQCCEIHFRNRYLTLMLFKKTQLKNLFDWSKFIWCLAFIHSILAWLPSSHKENANCKCPFQVFLCVKRVAAIGGILYQLDNITCKQSPGLWDNHCCFNSFHTSTKSLVLSNPHRALWVLFKPVIPSLCCLPLQH